MDLKPDNILLHNTTKTLKISDFGNSKVIEETDEDSQRYFKQGVATWQTMPPEMIVGQKFGIRADTWALGIILYQLCALKHPFEKNGKVEPIPILTKEVDLKPITELGVYSKATIDFIKTMLIKDSAKRPYLSELIFDFEIFFTELMLSKIEDTSSSRHQSLTKELQNWKTWKTQNDTK